MLCCISRASQASCFVHCALDFLNQLCIRLYFASYGAILLPSGMELGKLSTVSSAVRIVSGAAVAGVSARLYLQGAPPIHTIWRATWTHDGPARIGARMLAECPPASA